MKEDRINTFEKKPSLPGGANRYSKGPDKGKKDGLRVNREIRAAQVRVIDEAGEMLGVMSVPEAIRLAEDRGLDLLEIAPTASPPTCKIMDHGKYKYENKKKQAAARKKQVIVQIKEIQMRPRTDQHDFETKMRHGRRFLLDGDKVKISLRFLGREMAHQEEGFKLLSRAVEFIKDIGMVEAPPKMEGKQMFCMLAPDQTKIKDYLKANPDAMKRTGEAPKDEDLLEAGDDE